jgi:hypothetical protein
MGRATIPTTQKPGGVRAKHEPTEELRAQVRSLAGLGITQANIARLIGTDAETLAKYYRDDLDVGQAQAIVNISGKCYRAADKGNLTAMIFWLKCRAGWNENAAMRELGEKLDKAIEKLSEAQTQRGKA